MQRKAMHSFFARHSVDKEAAAHEWDSDTDPSAVFIAWSCGAGMPARPGPDGKGAKMGKAKGG